MSVGAEDGEVMITPFYEAFLEATPEVPVRSPPLFEPHPPRRRSVQLVQCLPRGAQRDAPIPAAR